jgi:uncharacterized protein involved in exopolysaccharide biosynthesis
MIERRQDPSGATSSSLPRDLWEAVVRGWRMHPWLAILVMLVTFAAIFGFGLRRRPYYETQSLIYVQPERVKLITDASGAAYDANRYDTFIQQQLQTIIRPDVLEDALSRPSTMPWRMPGETDQAAVVRLQQNLKVERDFGSYQLSITLGGGDPQAIAAVVNAVSESYIRRERSDELAQSDQQLQILKDERDRIRTSLSNDRREQAALSASLGIADTAAPDVANPFDVELADLRTQLAAASSAHAVAAVQYNTIASQGADSSDKLKAAADEIATADPGLIALKESVSQRRSLLQSQMAGLTPKHPLYQQDEQELKRLDQSLETATNQVRAKSAQQLQEKLKLTLDRTAKIESGLTEKLAEASAIAASATPKLQRAADLALDITRLQARFTEVDNSVHAIEVEKSTTGLVHILLLAEAPTSAKKSRKLLILGGAFPIALCCGLLVAAGRYKLDPKIYIGSDVGHVLRFPPMAVLPDESDVRSRVIDEFMLRLVAGVDQAHRTGGARTFVFTSSSPSSNISHLIAALAERVELFGYKALVMSAGAALRNVTLPKEELDYVLGMIQLSRPAKRVAEAERESYIVGNFSNIHQYCDLLFIEGLPLLSSSETEFASRLADVTVLVAESARTTRAELKHCLEVIKRIRVASVAAVLSHVQLKYADEEFKSAIRSVEERQSSTFADEAVPVNYEPAAGTLFVSRPDNFA